jgi:uncharacterized protein (DUF58 family)
VIIPGNRILLVFALTVLPATLANAFWSGGMGPSVTVFLVFCAVAAADAVAAMRRLKRITVSVPDRLNLTRNREGALDLRIAEAGRRPRSLQVGIEMPRSVISPLTNIPVRIPGEVFETGVSWPITATERGIHAIERCHLRMFSPLGLWYGQAAFPAGTVLHVYPALHAERRKLAALLLRRGDMMVRPHRQIGQGKEFEKLRPYLPGDSLADVHWKATAKRGHPVTKEFQIERTQEVYCIIDASRLSARMAEDEGGGRDTLLERYLSASLLLATIARNQGDLFGIMAFSDRPLAFIRAKGGAGHFGACREALSTVHTSLVTPNFEEMATFLSSRLRRRALLLFLTNLDEPVLAEEFTRSIRVLCRRHLVLVNTVKPSSAHPIFSGDLPNGLDEVYDRLGGHLVWHGLRQIQETLRLLGVELAVADHERLCATMVTRYLNVKRRQML